MVAGPYIGVVGSGIDDRELEGPAEAVGVAVAEAGGVLVCGGLGGVMAAACRGARSAGGTTVGLLPGTDRRAANEWVTIAITTGVGELRNALIVRSVDALIAVGGGYGTLSEVAFALKTGVPVVGLGTWDIDAIHVAPDARGAVERALALAAGSDLSDG